MIAAWGGGRTGIGRGTVRNPLPPFLLAVPGRRKFSMGLSAPIQTGPATRGRRDLSWRHATADDLRAIHWSSSLGRWRDPSELSKRANRVLRLFAALNRVGPHGYRGTRAELDPLAEAVHRATSEAASRSTVQRGLAELVAAGYLTKNHGRRSRVREIAPGVYTRDPICVFTLTDKAIDLWSSPPRFRSLPTSAHPGQNELASPCHSNRDLYPGMPARAIDPSAAPVELSERSDAEPATAGDVAPRGASPACVEPRQSPRRVAPLAPLAGCQDGQPQAPCQRGRLSERDRAAERFRGGTRPTTRREATVKILATLADVTAYLGNVGKMIRARAAIELAGGAAPVDRSGIEWDYWIARWAELSRDERRRFARSELVPLLRSPRPVLPAPPAPPAPSSPRSPAPTASPPRAREPVPEPPASSPSSESADPIGDALAAAAAAGNIFAADYIAKRRRSP